MKKTLSVFTVLLLFIINGCTKEEKSDPVSPSVEKKVASCTGCHTDYEHLKEVYTPDPPDPGGGGCGGETPHIEPYDRVYLGGEGYNQFLKTAHGRMPCTSCHNGNDNTADKDSAHSNNFLKKPSYAAEEKCGGCHNAIVHRMQNSLHTMGWGQKNMLTLRSGLGYAQEGFERLTALMKEGYDVNCAKCHAACGDCHVNRPKAGGGGLYNGHYFGMPDMRNHCTTCHTSRGGHAFFGVASGTDPDVHLTKASFTCVSCHKEEEIHSNGVTYNQRYDMPLLPKCEDCHSGVSNSNKYHKAHINSFSCYTCHSQDYNNCGSCHIGGVGARIPSHLKFKIAINPIPATRPYKYALVRQSLSAPDSWSNYGTSTLADFEAAPTYKYTTPHNISKITTRTGYENTDGNWVVYNNCTEGCHISKNSDGIYKNKELFLFNSDLEEWEKASDQNITVDGKLPSSWGVQ